MHEYAALVASPRALPDGLILVFQHPVKTRRTFKHFLLLVYKNVKGNIFKCQFFKELEDGLRRKTTTKKAESIEPRLLKKSQPVS